MECIRAYKFAAYPDEKRRKSIDSMLVLAQRLYNKILEKAIEEYKKEYHCNVCGLTIDRNENASINIRDNYRAGPVPEVTLGKIA